MLNLAACRWVEAHQNVIFSGQTGVGKRYLACALGQKACREGHSVVYRRSRRERSQRFASGSSPMTWIGGERTVELARATKEFDWKKLPKTLRVAIDSAPLEGAGRVEDTLNLLAHAARKVVECAADLLHWTARVPGGARSVPTPSSPAAATPFTYWASRDPLDVEESLYHKDNYPRLQRVKARWDPRDVFRHALSILLP